MMYKRGRTFFLTTISILISIQLIMAFTKLGTIPAVGPIVMSIAHIPIIVGVIILGLKGGLILGFNYGFLSLVVWTFIPPSPIAFIFTPFYSIGNISGNIWSLVVSFVPRILMPVLVYFLIKLFLKFIKSKYIASFLGASIGYMLSSIMLLYFVYIFFGQEYSSVLGVSYSVVLSVIITTILTSGIPESIISGFVASGMYKVLKK